MNNQLRGLFGTKGFFILFIIINCLIAQDKIAVSGKIMDVDTKRPIAGANIVSGEIGTVSDKNGNFSITIPSESVITISFIGYEEVTVTPVTNFLNIRMKSTVIKGEEVIVLANRAVAGVTPVAFSTLTQEEIAQYYTVEDVPMILASEPGIYAYSESGNGTGYSYVSIRGFDQSRIAVMLDNVPLNDNESHQVYWVDHGDILNDAQDVQIQRGVGNSLYGSAAFGGSINVITQIKSDVPIYDISFGSGSYNTKKYRLKYSSGKQFGNKFSITTRLSQIESSGYRENHESLQKAFSIGLEYNGVKVSNQFRGLIGYENTNLTWDGVYGNDINDRKLRRQGYKSYTDDFIQQIYSLNTSIRFNTKSLFHNVAYLVKGSGYYEVWKEDRDFYSYNLDVNDVYPDSVELHVLRTDLLRRKWIENTYYGVAPTLTLNSAQLRVDLGGELRLYTGDHFGEASQFSEPLLADINTPYRYYNYIGKKLSITTFAHILYSLSANLKLTADLQYQGHRWNLDQKKIGHAVGYQLSANWDFLNPRLGIVYKLDDNLSVFGNYGKSQKEPADDRIIEADDVWGEPVKAAAEVVNNYEIGGNYSNQNIAANLNIYQINFKNEQLKKIDVKQEGEYDYYSADATIHQGIEFEANYRYSSSLHFGLNGSLSRNIFSTGKMKNNALPNAPNQLLNFKVSYRPQPIFTIYGDLRYVGKQYVNITNDEKALIDPFYVVNLGLEASVGPAKFQVKINNLFDTLYATHGEDWGYGWIAYWPGATRNYYATVSFNF